LGGAGAGFFEGLDGAFGGEAAEDVDEDGVGFGDVEADVWEGSETSRSIMGRTLSLMMSRVMTGARICMIISYCRTYNHVLQLTVIAKQVVIL